MKSSPLILNSLDDAGRRLARIEAQPNDPKTRHGFKSLCTHIPNQGAVMGRKAVGQWSGNPSLYEDYLETLDAAPVVSQHARSDKKYIKHARLSADDLSVLLQAARKLVQQVQSEE